MGVGGNRGGGMGGGGMRGGGMGGGHDQFGLGHDADEYD